MRIITRKAIIVENDEKNIQYVRVNKDLWYALLNDVEVAFPGKLEKFYQSRLKKLKTSTS